MPTTFTAISLGNIADIDSFEGNNIAENASALVGQTFGASGNALLNNAVTWSPVGNPGSVFEMNNTVGNDQFSIDGGPTQTFDGTSIFNATITYIDGTTANITAVVAQDVNGNAYLMPEFTANTDQVALEAGAIRSITLNSLNGNNFSGLTANRQSWDLVTCFTSGTLIRTNCGERSVEQLSVGDKIQTLDHGLQTLRWIGQRTVQAQGPFSPVLIQAGALGNQRDLLVSQQHRMLLEDWRIELHTGHAEALLPAKQLVNGRDIRILPGGAVTYFHLMFDQHELVWAEGCLSESFHPGIQGWNSLDDAARQEILSLFPELAADGISTYGPTARPMLASYEARASAA
ncbi:Hint domain-containing protein [uncultured Ruegeria sp.]|uniref:Hint domain-containing protein n=1 Tax=uncultured Ruegeria sp. TaxID=259304 RepID=UPI002621C028|nr:Hint domain-containing protein [uncultured Ruegeria sp.]